MNEIQRVSVIIPTIGRHELLRAVLSAKGQVGHAEIEVIVIIDADQAEVTIDPAVAELADIVRWTGGGMRGGYARNLGVSCATGEWVAFLDDDDIWSPSKIATQLAMAEASRARQPVVAGRHVQFPSGNPMAISKPVPTTLIDRGESIATYLFRKRRPTGGRASMYTSTLMCRRQLAVEVPWDESLSRHQDWDWLVRLDRVVGVEINQVPDVVAKIQTGSQSSISAGSDWKASLDWADSVLIREGAGVYADFITAQCLRYAIASRSVGGVSEVLKRLFKTTRIPSIGPLVIAAAGILPRSAVERISLRR